MVPKKRALCLAGILLVNFSCNIRLEGARVETKEKVMLYSCRPRISLECAVWGSQPDMRDPDRRAPCACGPSSGITSTCLPLACMVIGSHLLTLECENRPRISFYTEQLLNVCWLFLERYLASSGRCYSGCHRWAILSIHEKVAAFDKHSYDSLTRQLSDCHLLSIVHSLFGNRIPRDRVPTAFYEDW